MYEKMTDAAIRTMQFANKKANELHHAYIGTEHILLGLLNVGPTEAWTVLQDLQINMQQLRCKIEEYLNPGPPMENLGKLPQTPRAKKVIEYACEESRSLEHNYIGTEHLLLGLLREQEGLAALVLTSMGMTLERTRDEVKYVLGMKEKPIRQIGTDTYLLRADDDPANRMQTLMQYLQELDRTMDITYVVVVTGKRKQ